MKGYFTTEVYKNESLKKSSKSAARVLNFIKSYHKEFGYAPSHKEIIENCEMSRQYVQTNIKHLEHTDFIEYGGGSRMIKILK